MSATNTALVADMRPELHADDARPDRAELPSLSVVIPTFTNRSDLVERLRAYRAALADIVEPLEILCVGGADTREAVRAIRDSDNGFDNLVAIELSVATSEEDALGIAIDRAKGDLILTLPGWREIDPDGLKDLFAALPGNDLVVGWRMDHSRALVGKARAGTLHWLVRKLFGRSFRDLFCRVRLGRREVFEDASRFGVRQHFIPLLVAWHGFEVEEVGLKANPTKSGGAEPVHFTLSGHFRAFVDLLTLFVTLKFLQRPLRFFGFIGMPMLAIGLAVSAYLVIARLVGAIALADRPLLTFSVLFIVLGIQIIAIGLVGEIVIYTAKRRLKNYEIAEIVRDGRIETPAAPLRQQGAATASEPRGNGSGRPIGAIRPL